MIQSESLAWTDSAGAHPVSPSRSERLHTLALSQYESVWCLLRRLGLPPHLADDGAQQAFVVVAQKIEDIREGSERAFLFQTAVRIALSTRRDAARRREVLDEELLEARVATEKGPDETTDEAKWRVYLDEVLDSLPYDCRVVFVLFEIEGMGSREISALLGIPVGTVASRLRRARELFRDAARRVRMRVERGGS